jgi:hypothetical protein
MSRYDFFIDFSPPSLLSLSPNQINKENANNVLKDSLSIFNSKFLLIFFIEMYEINTLRIKMFYFLNK